MIPDNSNRLPVNTAILTRFFAKVYLHPDMWYGTSQCWLWTGSRCKLKGYARLLYKGAPQRAHRLAYLFFVGEIPDETIDHLCRIRNCVNPAHLEPASNHTNVLRGNGPTARNARKTHCLRGHEFTPENIRFINTNGREGRTCRACEQVRRDLKRSQIVLISPLGFGIT